MSRRSCIAKGIVLAVLLVVAAYVRQVDLATHFAHYDDIGVANTIVQAKQQSLESAVARPARIFDPLIPYLSIGRLWTYAPLQFVATATLIKPGLSYRELIYRARLPSFFIGLFSLLAIFFLLIRLHAEFRFPAALFGTSLAVFSWEHVILSKHAANYVVGALATCLLLLVILHWETIARGRPARWVLAGFLAGGLAWVQYQALLFIPGFFLALLFIESRREGSRPGALLLRASMAAVAVLGLVIPLYHWFLKRVQGRGIHWNAGPQGEYVFPLELGNALGFFPRAAEAVLQSNLAFLPAESVFFVPMSIVLTGLLLLGLWRLCKSREPSRRALTIFLGTGAFVWGVFIIRRELALSPTRHTLILLPLLVILVVEGVRFLIDRFAGRDPGRTFLIASGAATFIVAFGFFCSFPSVVRERRDPFEPGWIRQKLAEHGVNEAVSYEYTQNLLAMANDLPGTVIHNLDTGVVGLDFLFPDNRRGPFAMVSHRMPLPPDVASRFQVLYRKEQDSRVESDFLNWTHNGTNGMYFYILNRR